MNILKKITIHKRKEVEERKVSLPIESLKQSMYFDRTVFSLKEKLATQDFGIIAEHKRQSPSKGVINGNVNVEEVVEGYVQAGAAGYSVLTDEEFFGGSNADLVHARQQVEVPILRKEFIIDEYQLIEAKAMGADVILLIAECLTKSEFKHLANFAKQLGLEILMEIHSEPQLEKLTDEVDMVGVNNRNLETFEVSIENSLKLIHQIPDTVVKISESGISNPLSVRLLNQAGYKGFLIGEHFMKEADPALACKNFIEMIHKMDAKTISAKNFNS